MLVGQNAAEHRRQVVGADGQRFGTEKDGAEPFDGAERDPRGQQARNVDFATLADDDLGFWSWGWAGPALGVIYEAAIDGRDGGTAGAAVVDEGGGAAVIGDGGIAGGAAVLENDDAAEFVENGGIVRGARVREQGGSVLFVGDGGVAGHARIEKGSPSAIAIGDGRVVGGACFAELRLPAYIVDAGGAGRAVGTKKAAKNGAAADLIGDGCRARRAEEKRLPTVSVGDDSGAGLAIAAEHQLAAGALHVAGIVDGGVGSRAAIIEVRNAATADKD